MVAIQSVNVALIVQALSGSTASIEQGVNVHPQQQPLWGTCTQNKTQCLYQHARFFVASITEVQASPKLADAAKTRENGAEQASEPSEYWTIFDIRLKITDSLLVLLTLFLATFTFLLVKVGWKQDATIKQQNRAFIGVDSVSLNDKGVIWKSGSGKPQIVKADFRNIGAYIVIKNSGNTPAYKVRHLAFVDVRRVNDEPTVFTPKLIPEKSMSAIPPGGNTTKNIIRPPRMTPEELEALKVGTSAIYVCGAVHYLDAFGAERVTNYKMKWFGNYPFHPSTGGYFCDDGNEAD